MVRYKSLANKETIMTVDYKQKVIDLAARNESMTLSCVPKEDGSIIYLILDITGEVNFCNYSNTNGRTEEYALAELLCSMRRWLPNKY
jgi:hypothetical protein